MQVDIRLRYEQTLDESHHGHPMVIETIRTGGRGRPRIHIDPDFLQWAYSQRSTASISRFLNVGRNTVRRALLDYGISESQEDPFPANHDVTGSDDGLELLERDDLLDPNLILPNQNALSIVSYTGPLSTVTDNDLDDLISNLRSHFHRAGISMLDGMLRRLGHRLPRDRIRESLMRIDPVQRIFQRIRIRRRVYSVPGPNSLWHHDGQHGQCVRALSVTTVFYTIAISRAHTVGDRHPWIY